MRILPSFDPSAQTNGIIAVGAADENAKLLIYNESSINVGLDFLNGNQCVIHANEARIVVLDSNTQEIHWFQHSVVAVIGASISLFIMELYGGSEELSGTYPISLTRTTITGNPSGVATTVTSTQTQLVNDGAVAATTLVESTQASSTGSNVFVTNSGNAYLAEYVASVYQKIFQVVAGATVGIILGATNRAVQVVGDLFFKGTLGVVVAGDILDGGSTGATYLKVRALGGPIVFHAGNVQIAQLDSTGIGIAASHDLVDVSSSTVTYFKAKGTNAGATLQAQGTGSVTLQSGGLNSIVCGGTNGTFNYGNLTMQNAGKINLNVGGIKDLSTFSGTGNGTFNHGLSGVPVDCWVTTSASSSTQTVGCTTFTATQVTITTGAGLAWRATAYR